MKMLVFRKLEYAKHNVCDYELYVQLQSNTLDFPQVLPLRFQTRATLLADGAYEVRSAAFSTSTDTNIASLAANGIWITKSDAVARGNTQPCVFGIPLTSRVIEALLLFPSSNVHVAYHGTSLEAWKSIASSKTLRASEGQMGIGVYLGSFWKACRFALRDQAYAWRPSNRVMRVLFYAKHFDLYPKPSRWCTCSKYCTGKTVEKASACDHLRDWQADAYDAATLQVGQFTDGTWITRNEEWVVKPQNILRLGEAVSIDQSSACQSHYDPLQRDLKIV